MYSAATLSGVRPKAAIRTGSGYFIMQNLIVRLSQIAREQNRQAYLVGGFVRDHLLKRYTADIDIAVSGNALVFARHTASQLDAKYVELDSDNGVARVIVSTPGAESYQIDLSSLQGDIQDDLGRRDFTVDAMASDLAGWAGNLDNATIIDPFHGADDLKSRKLRALNDHVFQADGVRLLRGIRLAAELDFTIEPCTEGLIRASAGLIAGGPGARVREELLRILAFTDSARWVRYMDNTGLLTGIFPPLAEAKVTTQPKEHHWNVFDHMVETLAATEYLLHEHEWPYGKSEIRQCIPWTSAVRAHFRNEVSRGSTRAMLVKMSALLHDIAKPRTKTVEESGKVRFLGHPQQWAEIADEIMTGLRFSRKEIDFVKTLIHYHLRPVQMAPDGELPTHRAIYRFCRDVDSAAIDVLFLALADYLATRGPELSLDHWHSHCRVINYILHESVRQKEAAPSWLVTGNDLISSFNLTPGKDIGRILAVLHEAQAVGEITNRNQALSLAKKILEEKETDLEKVK
jgi:poly(A) polymerase